jgi:nucleoside-triphosphatase THEP1
MVNELKPGHYITDFVSAGAKNYAYKISNSESGQCETVCKVRGIKTNYSAKHLVNFDVISNMILNPIERTSLSPYTQKRI